MTAYKVTIAKRVELSEVTIVCAECPTKVLAKVENGHIPMACPSCGKEYGDAVKNALSALGRFHREAKAAENISGKPVFEFAIMESN
jgi:phage FluMu protein Com